MHLGEENDGVGFTSTTVRTHLACYCSIRIAKLVTEDFGLKCYCEIQENGILL